MISKEQVEHIVKLARIELSEEEKGRFANDLSSILNYVDKLNQVDTSKVGPIKQITGLENIMREDEAKKNDKATREKLLEEAPKRKGDYIQVPKILE